MMEKPILFNAEMVRAILDGRKTVTRRVVKNFVPDDAEFGYTVFTPEGCISARGVFEDGYGEKFYKLPCRPGDILWVRETWVKCQNAESYVYKADFYGYSAEVFLPRMKWHPSIHMPREAARIFLRVTDVRVERLQAVNFFDCINEGMPYKQFEAQIIEDFANIWDSTIKPKDRDRYGWASNPWAWVIEFERCEK